MSSVCLGSVIFHRETRTSSHMCSPVVCVELPACFIPTPGQPLSSVNPVTALTCLLRTYVGASIKRRVHVTLSCLKVCLKVQTHR